VVRMSPNPRNGSAHRANVPGFNLHFVTPEPIRAGQGAIYFHINHPLTDKRVRGAMRASKLEIQGLDLTTGRIQNCPYSICRVAIRDSANSECGNVCWAIECASKVLSVKNVADKKAF